MSLRHRSAQKCRTRSEDLCYLSWWRHRIETFSALLAICAGNSPASGDFPAQTPVTRSFDVFFDLCLNKRLGKLSWGWWFETLSRPLWRQCNGDIWNETFGVDHFFLASVWQQIACVKAADDDAGKPQPVFLKRLYLLHICIFSFFLFNASLTTI